MLLALNLHEDFLEGLVIRGKRILLTHEDALGFDYQISKILSNRHFDYNKEALMRAKKLQTVWSKKTLEYRGTYGVVLSFGACPSPTFDLQRLAGAESISKRKKFYLSPFRLAEWYLSKKQKSVEPTVLAKIWLEILGTPLIPLNSKQRQKKLAQSYEQLAPHISAYRDAK
jgi:hypothetical protein